MIYLSSLTNLMDIVKKYAAFACIINFDNLYGASLLESKIKQVAGKKVTTEFKRYMADEREQRRQVHDFKKNLFWLKMLRLV